MKKNYFLNGTKKVTNSYYLKILSIILLISPPIFSQGEFLQKGTSGLSIASGYHYAEDYYDMNGKLGYSVKGVFDFGVGITNGINRQKILNYDLKKLSLNPFIAITNHSGPLILSINFSYRHDFIKSDAFDILDIKAKGDYYSVGSSLRVRIAASKSFFIQPMISADYVAGRSKAFNDPPVNLQPNAGIEFSLFRSSIKDDSIYQEIPAGQTRSDFSQELIFNFGMDFCLKASNRLIFRITPNIRLHKSDKFLGVNAGIVLPALTSKTESFEKKPAKAPSIPQENVVYLDIENVLKKYFLIRLNSETPMKEGYTFYIVRADTRDGVNWNKIGVAKVVKIQGDKAVLESDLYDENDQVTIRDKVLYRY